MVYSTFPTSLRTSLSTYIDSSWKPKRTAKYAEETMARPLGPNGCRIGCSAPLVLSVAISEDIAMG